METSFVRIFRIESPEGEGPYQRSFLFGVDEDDFLRYKWETGYRMPHSINERTPSVLKDIGRSRVNRFFKHSSDFNCGFNSLSQLKKWFTKAERKNLSEMGFQIVVFHVQNGYVLSGNHQVIFDKDHSEKAGVLSWNI